MAKAGGPKVLLRRLREIMAEQVSAQMRLDRLVNLIAANMVAEVCSIYLRRAGNAYELFATEGLNPSAVHHTRLREGEGLVGLVGAAAKSMVFSPSRTAPRVSITRKKLRLCRPSQWCWLKSLRMAPYST